MKTVAICQARMGSTRLPGKVMKDLFGFPLLQWTIEACHQSDLISDTVLATSTLVADDKIAQYCKENGIPCFRGSESDVLDRFYQCAKHHKADIVLRFTCDCPFLDPAIIDQVIKLREMKNADYASNCYPPTYPDGLDTECFTFSALEAAWTEAKSSVDRDCLTQFIVRNRDRFKVVNLTNPLPNGENEHWVCDSADDFKFCEEIANRITRSPPSYLQILEILDKEPELREINKGSIRNERFYEALSEERLPARTFTRSHGIFERAIARIPLGAQTYSKSFLQFPLGQSPLYVSHGDGAYIFDVDGNRYVDLINSIYPVILGYNDPDVDRAIRDQLDRGISFSLATKLESELAETLCRLIPCAEMVKFGKTGTDVTSAAIRLARAHTGRSHILTSGYHGWADWSMGPTNRHSGIPEAVRSLTHSFKLGDYNGFNQLLADYQDDIAAIVVEPNDDPTFLGFLRPRCSAFGIVLIFDEIITGFRYAMGGAQELYEVTPDLACFGKSMANGMPISALVGKREIMSKLESPDVFYSGTFFGETLSIAAAIATINKMEEQDVIADLWQKGTRLEFEILKLIKKWDISDVIEVNGLYPCLKIKFKDSHIGRAKGDQVRALFMRMMFQYGVLIMGSNAISYAMKGPEMKRIVTAYDETFNDIAEALRDGSIVNVDPVEAAPLRVS